MARPRPTSGRTSTCFIGPSPPAGDQLGCFSPADAKFVSLQTLAEGWKHLQAAEKAAGTNEALLLRVRTAQLPILYTFIIQWDRLRKEAELAKADWPMPDTQRAVYDQFMKTAETIKMTHVAKAAASTGSNRRFK